jgi:hypothetical protein
MASGKTTQTGLGDRKPNRSTSLGLKVEKKKIVTKRGLVAPSPEDPARLEEFVPESLRPGPESEIVARNEQQAPRASEAPGVHPKTTDPRGMTPPPPLDQMQFGEEGGFDEDLTVIDSTRELETDPFGMDAPEPEGGELTLDIDGRVAAHEDITPREGSEIDDSEARSRFRTSPGGGLNRISGGREHAAAYVSPITVKPGTPTTPVTGAVKVMDVVEKAVRAYKTEPSLLRRRLSSLPPKMPPPETRMHLLVGAIAIGLVIGAMLFWAAVRTNAFDLPGTGRATKPQAPEATARGAALPPKPVLPQKEKISRNESESRPKTQAEGESEAAPQGASPGQDPAPTVTQEKAATPSPSKVHEAAPVVNLPRSDTKPAVKKAAPAPAAESPEKSVGAGEAKKPSSQDLWLQ